MQYVITIKLLSPIHLSSGRANVNIDIDVAHDRWGLPIFSAKRFKGLLYESALEVAEMSEACGSQLLTMEEVQKVFNRSEREANKITVSDFTLPNYDAITKEWAYLQETYPTMIRPEDVLNTYTSVRYQTAVAYETGLTLNTSLHNMRVVDKDTVDGKPMTFEGIIEMQDPSERDEEILALALQNLSAAGLKRNRGFGRIACTMKNQKAIVERALAKGGL